MADVSAARTKAVFEFKSATLPLIAVILKTADLAVLAEALDAQLADSPDFFEQEPVVIDLSQLQPEEEEGGEEPAALGFLTVDLERRVAYNILTATFPAYRRRGLALLVKLASIRWAAENGIERVLTENDAENASVLALNKRLGYRRLYDQGTWALERVRVPSERG